MNKKGVEGMKVPLYFMADLIIGMLVLVILVVGVPRIMFGSTEEVMAKDLALSIMAISASPYDLTLDYDKNTENYEVLIDEEKVKIKSEEGAGSYRYLSLIGVTVQGALITNTISIPIMMKDSIIYFKDTESDYTDFCQEIPLTLEENTLKLKITIEEDETGETKKNLELVKAGIITRYSTSSNNIGKIQTVNSDEDLLMVLGTSSGKEAKVSYYSNEEKQETLIYKRISCYVEKSLKEDFKSQFSGVQTLAFNDANTIKIDFGDPANVNKDVAGPVSVGIYKALILGITS